MAEPTYEGLYVYITVLNTEEVLNGGDEEVPVTVAVESSPLLGPKGVIFMLEATLASLKEGT